MTETSSLEGLLKQARKGDKAAEDEIFRRLLVRFRYIAARRVGDEGAADDIAQAACMTVLERYQTQSFSVEFGAWTYGVLKMLIRKHFSRQTAERKRTGPMPGEGSGEAVANDCDPDVEIRLTRCLEKVAAANRRYARVLNLTYQGYPTEEICARIKVNRNHLYVLLNRARSMLWGCLQGTKE